MSDPVWIEKQETLLFHERLLVQHGGALGVRDEGMLASALARPKQIAAYADLPDMARLAAAYTTGIVKNHPFFDSNKRTGFLVGVLFLEMNGYRFTASQETAANAVIMLAAGDLDERGYAEFLAANITAAS